MKIFERSHLAIVFSLVLIAGGVWFARFVSLNAASDVLKPQMVSHNGNVIDPRTGEEDGSAAFDIDEAGDRTTFANIFLHDDGTSSQVLFYDFDDPSDGATSFRLGINYSYIQNEGDDGFLIQYSNAGSTSCSDVNGRDWVTVDEVQTVGEKRTKEFILTDVQSTEVCVKVDAIVNGEVDSSGYKFRDSNSLKIYDVWLETAEADVKMSVLTPATYFAVDQAFQYSVTAKNLGAAPAENVESVFKLPRAVDYVSAIPSHGTYDVGTGKWIIGELGPDEVADLLVTVRLADGYAGDVIQASASVEYYDPFYDVDRGHGNSTKFTVSDVPSEIAIIELPQPVVEEDEGEEEQDTPEEPVSEDDIDQSASVGCSFDCNRTGFFLYIVNPDGTTRDTHSSYAKITALGDRHFRVSFEDKGVDFDYNDIAFELNVVDCRNVSVTMTDMNAGWHHQVRANVTFDDLLQDSIVLWEDSHTGVGQTLTFDLYDYISPNYLTCE